MTQIQTYYPPAHWRYAGKRNGPHVLENVKPAAQSRAYPDQFVSWATVQRIMAE